jgi:ABC-type Fe3+-hydroxamate transport system substrate-binding protein
MRKILFLLPAFLLLTLSACSLQSSGSNAYQAPNTVSTNIAVIKIASSNVSVIDIDGKSVYLNAKNTSTTLNPGQHNITIGNNMVLLTAVFKANNTYLVKSDGSHVWIENSQGKKVTPVTLLTSI